LDRNKWLGPASAKAYLISLEIGRSPLGRLSFLFDERELHPL
jgi:hypothetical protein